MDLAWYSRVHVDSGEGAVTVAVSAVPSLPTVAVAITTARIWIATTSVSVSVGSPGTVVTLRFAALRLVPALPARGDLFVSTATG
jgi:hypothetical protein